MWVKVTDIPDEGLQLELRESPLEFPLKADEVKVCAFVEFNARLDKLSSGILVRGALKTTTELVCARCLEPFQFPVSSRVEVEYHFETGEAPEEDAELIEENTDVYPYTGDKIDLSEATRDQILLAIPMKPLCLPECKGLCRRCGANLNRGVCGCPAENMDPRLQALRALRKELEE